MAQPESFEEALLVESEFSLVEHPNGIVITLELDLGAHLTVFGLRVAVRWVVLRRMWAFGYDPCFVEAVPA